MQHREFVFTLSISPDEYLRYYQGAARNVVAHASDGRTVRFPARELRAYVTRDGVHGRFRLRCDRHNRLVSFERISEGGDDV